MDCSRSTARRPGVLVGNPSGGETMQPQKAAVETEFFDQPANQGVPFSARAILVMWELKPRIRACNKVSPCIQHARNIRIEIGSPWYRRPLLDNVLLHPTATFGSLFLSA